MNSSESSDASSSGSLNSRFRDALKDSIHTALRTETDTLITAPTSLGKTHTIATTRWKLKHRVSGSSPLGGDDPVVHVSQTRKARDQAAEMSRNAGVDYHVIKGREDACPVASGDYDDELLIPGSGQTPSEWFNLKCDVQGIPFSKAHSDLDSKLGDLPCMETGLCQGMAQWIPLLDDDRDQFFDIIHVTDTFVYNTQLIAGRNIVFDEQPTYIRQVPKEVTSLDQLGRTLTQNRIRTGISKFLNRCLPKEPYTNWEGLIIAARSGASDYREAVLTQIEDAEFDPSWYLDSSSVHTSVPTLIKAILNGENVGNDRFKGQVTIPADSTWHDSDSDDRTGTRQVTVVLDAENNIKLIHEPPDLSPARCVIGLDAHPTERLWRVNTVDNLRIDDLGLAPDELREWRRAERGLTVYQVGDATRAYTRGWAGDTIEEQERTRDRADALIRAVRRKHGDDFRTAITAKSIHKEVEQMMADAGVPDPEVRYYGNLKSINAFKSETVGLLIGCIDPGDHNIQDTLALLGLKASPKMTETEDGNIVRETGRGFTGPDSDAATEILGSVREMMVAQAIGRYARTPGQSGSHATVYAWTDAVPEALSDGTVPGIEDVLAGKRRVIVEFVGDSDSWVTCKEIRQGVLEQNLLLSLSKEHVRQTMVAMVNRDAATISKGTGYYGADEFRLDPDAVTDLVDLNLDLKS